MENINDILKNQGGENNQPSTAGGQNPVPQNEGYQNPAVPSTGYKNPTPPKKDNKKLIAIIAVIAAVIVVAVAVACMFIFGGNSQSTTADGTFDIEKIINNITIDGEHYEWFSSLNDLGPDWDWSEYGEPSVMWPGTEPSAVVEYKGEEVFTGSLCNYNKEHEREALFISMRVTNDRVSIDGLMVGMSKNDVLEKYGEPTEYKQGNFEYFYYTIEHDCKELIISFKNEKIYSFSITYYPEEYRTK